MYADQETGLYYWGARYYDPKIGRGISADRMSVAEHVEKWRAKVEVVSNARQKGMLKVVLGEMLEHARLFDQAAAGRKDLIGTSLAINDHPGVVMANRWTGD